MTKGERLKVFFERLTAATPSSSGTEAYDLICLTFIAVEAEFAGDDDKMLPPSGDFYYEVPGRPDLDLYRQNHHDTIIRNNGAILIRVRRTAKVEFEKPGSDGRKVEL